MPNDKKNQDQNQTKNQGTTGMGQNNQSDISSKGGMSQGQENSSENSRSSNDTTGTDWESGQN